LLIEIEREIISIIVGTAGRVVVTDYLYRCTGVIHIYIDVYDEDEEDND